MCGAGFIGIPPRAFAIGMAEAARGSNVLRAARNPLHLTVVRTVIR
jgi:hypothetical protein